MQMAAVILSLILLQPARLYFQRGQPIPVRIDTQAMAQLAHVDAASPLVLLLLGGDGRLYGKAALQPGVKEVDLASLFGKKDGRPFSLWDGHTYFIQLQAAGQAVGSPLVVAPLKQPGHVQDEPDALRIYPEQLVEMRTTLGSIFIRLDPEAAPHTTQVFSDLVAGGFYTRLLFHRVVPGFVIQGGDPAGNGSGGPGFFTDLEPSTKPHQRGTVSMARQGNGVNTAGSQFFICLSRQGCAALDQHYTAFGDVVAGMATVDRITALPTLKDGTARPVSPPMILEAKLIPAPPRPVETPPPATIKVPAG
jgi:peptidyl-prolyl cis-trans isomerase B (cyclophilin B)